MFSLRTRTAVPALAIAAIAVLTLTACGGSDEPAAAPDDTVTTDAAAPDAPDDEAAEPEDAVGALFPGTGEYAIGTDIPYGGFQLLGEPTEQPDGCTWSIVDEDGVVAFENQGPYVFLTDIQEAVTFITNGCPDWEQFE